MNEHLIYCPHCNGEVSVLADPETLELHYSEDCELCSHPIEIDLSLQSGRLSPAILELVEA